MRKLLALLFVLVVAVAAVGCSSDGSDGAADEETTTTADEETTTTEGEDGSGGDDDDVSDVTAQDYEAALVTNLSSGSQESGDLVLDAGQAECLAPKWLEAITVDLLKENGVTVEDLSDTSFDGSALGMTEEQGQEMVDAFAACDVDYVELFSAALTQGLEPDQQACVAENVDDELLGDLLAKSFSGIDSDAEFEALLAQLTEDCDLPA